MNRIKCGVAACAALLLLAPVPLAAVQAAAAVSMDSATIATIRARLIEHARRDQVIRGNTAAHTTADHAALSPAVVDSVNAVFVAGVLEQVGWPDSIRFGADGSRAAWILIQHADRDLALQVRALGMLAAAVTRGAADARHAAMLTDRVRMRQGRPQVYGSQYDVSGHGTDGQPVYIIPVVEDPDRLDERRRHVGLEPWAEYEARMARLQNRAAVARPRPDTDEALIEPRP